MKTQAHLDKATHQDTQYPAEKTFICAVCKTEHDCLKPGSITTGYGLNAKNEKVCYACCAEADRQYMLDNGRITLYLTGNAKDG